MADSSRPDFWDTRYRDHVMPWDAGGVPADLRAFAGRLPERARLLIPGCGSGYEVGYLAGRGFDVLALDFSREAVELARKNAGPFADRVQYADFFAFDPGVVRFDAIYERAFLCALPRNLWPVYAERMAQLLQPGTALAGFFFYANAPRGPPFGTSASELHELLDPNFALAEDRPASESLPVFQGSERWQVWQRR
jgi:SAM-dependent methyltransferase